MRSNGIKPSHLSWRTLTIGITFLLSSVFILTCPAAYAQTVSIITGASDTESTQVEAAMKRLLRAEGYTVKGSTNEGIVVLLEVMRVTTKGGTYRGLAGHVTIVSVGWQGYADTLVSASCKADHELAQNVSDYLGTRVILHTRGLATGADAEGLAEMLSEGYVNGTVRETIRKQQKFFDDLDKGKDGQSKDVINPYR